MRNLTTLDAFLFVAFSHVFGFIFSMLIVVEQHRHNCTGIGRFNGLSMAYTGIAILIFVGLAYNEWRRERREEMATYDHTLVATHDDDDDV